MCWRSVGSEQGVLLWGQVLLAVGVLLGGAIGGGGGGGAMAWLAGGAARLPVLAGTRKPSIKCSSSYISSFGVEDRHHHHYHRRQRIQRQLARQAQTLEGAAVAGREYNDPAMKGPEIEIEVVVLPVISSATMVPRSVSQDGFGLPWLSLCLSLRGSTVWSMSIENRHACRIVLGSSDTRGANC